MSCAMAAEPSTPGGPDGLGLGKPARLQQPSVSNEDRNYAIAIHLTPLLCFVAPPLLFTPLVLWLIRRNSSVFVDDHGREMINALITMVIVAVLVLTVIWIPIAIAWVIVTFINLIRGAIAASNGEYFRYPMLIRFLS